MVSLAASAWGLGMYGLGAYGAALPISIHEAYPLGPRRIYVRFNTPPQFASPIAQGDIQNRKTWDLTRGDTGERIEVIGAIRGKDALEWALVLLTSIGPSYVQHTLGAARLRSAGILPATPPTVVTFFGVDVEKPPFAVRDRNQVVDLKNDNFFGQGIAIRPDSGGNYEVQVGAAGLRKRILRILTTKPGEWPSDPDFGVDLGLSELARDPVGMKQRIEEQIRRDPEVSAVGVSVSDDSTGVIRIIVRARMTTGSEVSAEYRADSGGVRLV